MQKVIAVSGALLLLLGGCASVKPDMSELSLEARTALMQAEVDVKMADAKKANTVAAHEALDKAREAAAKGNDADVVKYGGIADKEALIAAKKAK